jgi:hypothetical protein
MAFSVSKVRQVMVSSLGPPPEQELVTPCTKGDGMCEQSEALGQATMGLIIIMIINPCKPYLTASAPRLTHWGGGE